MLHTLLIVLAINAALGVLILFLPLVLKVAHAIDRLGFAASSLVANLVNRAIRRLPRWPRAVVLLLFFIAYGVGVVVAVSQVAVIHWLAWVWLVSVILDRTSTAVQKVWPWWRARRSPQVQRVRDILDEYDAEVEAGRVLWPDVYAARVRVLHGRGLASDVCAKLCHAGDIGLLRQIEALDDWQLWWVNWAEHR